MATLAAAMAISALLMLTALAIHQVKREASLMGELSHRVKNILAVLGAVIERAREHSQSMDELVSSLRVASNRCRIHKLCLAGTMRAASVSTILSSASCSLTQPAATRASTGLPFISRRARRTR